MLPASKRQTLLAPDLFASSCGGLESDNSLQRLEFAIKDCPFALLGPEVFRLRVGAAAYLCFPICKAPRSTGPNRDRGAPEKSSLGASMMFPAPIALLPGRK